MFLVHIPTHFTLQGANSHGQLGLATVSEQVEKPTKVEINFFNKDHSVKQISCGGGHTLLLDSDGGLYSCGWNIKEQLGKAKETSIFERVWNLSGVTFTNIACGWDFSCGVTDSQLLFVWGSNSHGQLGLPKNHFSDPVKPTRLQVNACAVSMGLRHTAIINSKGEVWITGCGKHGQLGLGPDMLSSDRFLQVPKIGSISHISCGQNHTIGWSSEEHALYVWGDNKHGQLLLSSDKYKKIYVPQKIDIDVKQEVKKLLSGWTNALLWLENGELLTWGRNSYGQLGTEAPFVGKIIHVNLPGWFKKYLRLVSKVMDDGRWTSNIVKLILQTFLFQKAELSKMLHWVQSTLFVWPLTTPYGLGGGMNMPILAQVGKRTFSNLLEFILVV